MKISPELRERCEAGIRGIFHDDPAECDQQIAIFRATCALGDPDVNTKKNMGKVAAYIKKMRSGS